MKVKAAVISDCQKLIRENIYSKTHDGIGLYDCDDNREKSFVIESLNNIQTSMQGAANLHQINNIPCQNEIKRQVVTIPLVPQSTNLIDGAKSNFSDRRSSEMARRPGNRSPIEDHIPNTSFR